MIWLIVHDTLPPFLRYHYGRQKAEKLYRNGGLSLAVYAIGDLHLSLSMNKPMDIFGGRWQNYMEKLNEGLSVLTDDDTLVLCGDFSWAMTLMQALPDFQYVHNFNCKTIYLVKGNHDYWWETANKMQNFWNAHGLHKFKLLHNNAHVCEEFVFCGTRGWFYEEERGEHSAKIMNRELMRLRTSLQEAQKYPDKEVTCFLHYPPMIESYTCKEVVDLMLEYNVMRCFYGHLHGKSCNRAKLGVRGGLDYQLISADFLNFKPFRL